MSLVRLVMNSRFIPLRLPWRKIPLLWSNNISILTPWNSILHTDVNPIPIFFQRRLHHVLWWQTWGSSFIFKRTFCCWLIIYIEVFRLFIFFLFQDGLTPIELCLHFGKSGRTYEIIKLMKNNPGLGNYLYDSIKHCALYKFGYWKDVPPLYNNQSVMNIYCSFLLFFLS